MKKFELNKEREDFLVSRNIDIKSVEVRSEYETDYGVYINISGYYSTSKDVYQVALFLTKDSVTPILTRKSDDSVLHLDIKDINKVFAGIKSTASKETVSIDSL